MAAITTELPSWLLKRPKSALQSATDLVGAPLRMALLPDRAAERLHLTSLRAERFAAVLPTLRGRVADVGAGDNLLVLLYRRYAVHLGQSASEACQSVGFDIISWAPDVVQISNAATLPLPDASVDTVSFIACLNHIPERAAALLEARRVLKPDGRIVITMIGRALGDLGHRIWWYSEDKHRQVHEEELMGMDSPEILSLLRDAGFEPVDHSRFLYGLNNLYVATAP